MVTVYDAFLAGFNKKPLLADPEKKTPAGDLLYSYRAGVTSIAELDKRAGERFSRGEISYCAINEYDNEYLTDNPHLEFVCTVSFSTSEECKAYREGARLAKNVLVTPAKYDYSTRLCVLHVYKCKE